ncbi:UNVERIFIED_CONTAM: hypothetical protein FKN15_033547 [Acipenser sinensis]
MQGVVRLQGLTRYNMQFKLFQAELIASQLPDRDAGDRTVQQSSAVGLAAPVSCEEYERANLLITGSLDSTSCPVPSAAL